MKFVDKLRIPAFILALLLSFAGLAHANPSGGEAAEEMGQKEVDAAKAEVIKDLRAGDFKKYAKDYQKLKEERAKAEKEEKEKEEKK